MKYLVCHSSFLQEATRILREMREDPSKCDPSRRCYLNLPLRTDPLFRRWGIGVRGVTPFEDT